MTNLEKMMGQIKNPRVYIQTHNFPDPDAIASAFGLQGLLKYKGIDAVICYKGKIDRYNTLKLMELLDIRLENLEEIDDSLKESDEVVLVDAQKGNSNIIDMTGDEIICIDHHPTYEKVEYRFADIRPELGACSTLIAMYYFENKVPMDVRTATALSYGIRCDTDKLSRGTSREDLEMLYRMYDNSDQEMIHMLENRNLFFDELLSFTKAIESIRVYDRFSFSCAGSNCPEALIASVSDFMLALVEVDFSVVYAIQKHGIKLSVRSEEGGYDAGQVISRALKGIGSGGGHGVMAGGFVPLKDGEAPEEMIDVIQKRVLEEIRASEGD